MGSLDMPLWLRAGCLAAGERFQKDTRTTRSAAARSFGRSSSVSLGGHPVTPSQQQEALPGSYLSVVIKMPFQLCWEQQWPIRCPAVMFHLVAYFSWPMGCQRRLKSLNIQHCHSFPGWCTADYFIVDTWKSQLGSFLGFLCSAVPQ